MTTINPTAARLLERITKAMEKAPLDAHLEILFGADEIAGRSFADLYRHCIEKADQPVPEFKRITRPQRALTLARYFEHTLALEGFTAECGVLKGFSALLLAEVARHHDRAFTGAGFYLMDSFEGLSFPNIKDATDIRDLPDGSKQVITSHPPGHFASPRDVAAKTLSEFPEVNLLKGWVPDVFAELPDVKWAFVHLDLDLYEPTLAGLEYFWPRLVPGGVIVNDDYNSENFPGAGIAWDEFCTAHGIGSAVLDTGQAAILKD